MYNFLIGLLLLSSSIYTLKFNFIFINLRLIHIISILSFIYILFIYLYNSKSISFKIKNKKLTFIFFLILFFLYPFSIYKSPIRIESILLYISLLLSLFAFFNFKIIWENISHKKYVIVKIIKFNIFFSITVVIIEFILSVLTSYNPSQAGQGWFGLARPGGFLGDTNYFAIWIAFLALILTCLNNCGIEIKRIRLIYFSVFIITILIQARVIILLLILAPFIIFHKKILGRFWWINYFYLIIFGLAIIRFLIFSSFLPERFTYDILNPEKNPRLQDSIIVLDELFLEDMQFFGRGLGTTKLIQERQKWSRSFNKVINVGPAYIIHDFGYFGLFLFLLLIYFFYASLYFREIKIIFILLMLTNIFHMQLYLPWFWFLIALMQISNKLIYYEKNKIILEKLNE